MRATIRSAPELEAWVTAGTVTGSRLPGGRRGVALLDGVADSGPALGRREALLLLDLRRLVGQLRVLDDVAEPAGIVARPEVVRPGVVVDAVGDLHEQREVLDPEP